MPRYVIERQYLLPVYEQLLIEAPSLEAACREALDEEIHPWTEAAEQDFDSASSATITRAVRLSGAAAVRAGYDGQGYGALGEILYHAGLDPLPVPHEFGRKGTSEGK